MYEMDARVRYSEVDNKGNLTIAALIAYLQDTCNFQGLDLGYTLDVMNDQHVGWYIINWQIDIKFLPKLGERIVIMTWPHMFRGMLAYRCFTLVNEAGEVLVEANSIWVLMNLVKMHPERIPTEMQKAYGTSPAPEREWGDRKLHPVEELREVKVVTVEPLHLDTNNHMNNERYIEIARDVLPPGTKIYGISTEYRRQAVLGDELHVLLGQKGPDHWQVVMGGKEGEKNYAVVEFITKPL